MVTVEITNIEEFKVELQKYLDKVMFVYGQLIVNAIQKQIEDMKLQDNGDFWRGIHSFYSNKELMIEDAVFYGVYLEYGTFSYFSQYGLENFPKNVDPKKKEISAKLRKAFPKGMQPFSPFRKVVFNDKIMTKLLQESFNAVNRMGIVS